MDASREVLYINLLFIELILIRQIEVNDKDMLDLIECNRDQFNHNWFHGKHFFPPLLLNIIEIVSLFYGGVRLILVNPIRQLVIFRSNNGLGFYEDMKLSIV